MARSAERRPSEPAGPPEVTLAVVSWNSGRVLPDLLGSIPAACAGVAGYEVVVADNASDDDSVAIARERGARVVQTGRNAGYAAGVNAAVAASRGVRAVLVLNADLVLRPGCVRRLLDGLELPAAGITVPRLVGPDGRLQRSLRREPSIPRALGEALLGGRAGRWPALGETITDPREYERPCTADWASGAAMLVSRECLRDVGAWDESFFLYSEETDFALRARDGGYRLWYVPDAVVVHEQGDLHDSPRLFAMLTINRIRCYRRRHGRLAGAAFRGSVVLGEALRAVAGRQRSRVALLAAVSRSRRPAEVDGP